MISLPILLLAASLGRPQALVSGVAASAQAYNVDQAFASSIVEKESQFKDVVHRNADGSLDVGRWQVNQRWHPGERDGAPFLALCLFRARYDMARAAAYYHRGWRVDAKGKAYAKAVMAIYQRIAGGMGNGPALPSQVSVVFLLQRRLAPASMALQPFLAPRRGLDMEAVSG